MEMQYQLQSIKTVADIVNKALWLLHEYIG